jgi:DNA-binding PadR family transcriptional regulator
MKKCQSKQTTSVEITERDLEIFRKLNAAGWLSTGQLLNYFFRGKSANAVSKRLRKLVRDGYLTYARVGSTEPAYYRLAAKGKLILAANSLLEEPDIQIPKRLPTNLSHFSRINDLRLHFEEGASQAGVRLLYFFSDQELRRYLVGRETIADNLIQEIKDRKLFPDGLCRIRMEDRDPERGVTLALEYDAGTENTSFFGATKIASYAKLLCHQRGGAPLLVLTFADRISRVVSLMRTAVLHQAPRQLFYFAPINSLSDYQWMSHEIFLEPYDFFSPCCRAGKLEVIEKDLSDRLRKYAFLDLLAGTPRNLSSR